MNVYRNTFTLILVSLILLMGCVEPQPGSAEHELSQATMNTTIIMKPTSGYSLFAGPDYIADAQMFDEAEAMTYVEFLASEEMQGRLVGRNQRAGDYIADHFAHYGLEPAGISGSYFQSFTSPVTKNILQPVLEIVNTGLTYDAHDDFVPRIGGYLGSGKAEGLVIWLGNCNHSDFNPSLANQIILCAPLSGSETSRAVQKALQYNVGGLLIIREDDPPYARSGYGLGDLIDIPAFRVSYAIAEDLLAGSGYSLSRLKNHAIPVPTTLATFVHMDNAFERTTIQARNVLGLMRGSDPQLQDEILIVGAHYDHVGVDPDGTIYPGANDNASGMAVILEIVRLWQEIGYQPARSVLFAAWDAEEQGLYGSQYYVDHPIYPQWQTLAYLNLDMVGVGDLMYIYGYDGNNAMSDQLKISADVFGISTRFVSDHLADDLPFYNAGIPTGTYTLEASSSYPVNLPPPEHDPLQTHRPGDTPQNIRLESLRTIGVLATHVLFSWDGIP